MKASCIACRLTARVERFVDSCEILAQNRMNTASYHASSRTEPPKTASFRRVSSKFDDDFNEELAQHRAIKPSATRLQHARVWSAAKLVQRGIAIVPRAWTGGAERAMARNSRVTAIIRPSRMISRSFPPGLPCGQKLTANFLRSHPAWTNFDQDQKILDTMLEHQWGEPPLTLNYPDPSPASLNSHPQV